jgi:hypothetical protein
MSKALDKLQAALADAVASRDSQHQAVNALQHRIDEPENGPDWADANSSIGKASQILADRINAMADAQRAYDDARNTEFLDNIVPTMLPLDRANHDNLDTVRTALDLLLDGAKKRDSVAASKTAGASTIIGSPRVQPDARFPSVDQYRLSATRSNVVVELARILEPVFSGLGDGFLAQQMHAAIRSGNPLPQPPEETA